MAIERLPGGVAAAVGGLQPLFVAVLTRLTTGRPSANPRRDLVVGVVAALGVALVVVRPGADVDAVGIMAAVAANLSFAFGVVLTKRFTVSGNRLASTGWQLALGGMVLLPLAVAVEGPPPALDLGDVSGFAYLSIVCTAVAFVVWFDGIRHLPAAAPPLLGLAAPITGAITGWVVLGQSLTPECSSASRRGCCRRRRRTPGAARRAP